MIYLSKGNSFERFQIMYNDKIVNSYIYLEQRLIMKKSGIS